MKLLYEKSKIYVLLSTLVVLIPLMTGCNLINNKSNFLSLKTETQPTPENIKPKQLTKVIEYDSEDDYQYVFEYDDKGHLSSSRKGYINDDYISKITYTYDENGKLIWAISGTPVDKCVFGENSGSGYTYNANGQLIKELSWEGSAVDTLFEYDKEGTLVCSTEDYGFGSSTTKYTHDSNGVLVSSYTSVRPAEGVDSDAYSYTCTYDYSCKPFVIETSDYIDRYYDSSIILYNNDRVSILELSFKKPKYYLDADGYLAKVETKDSYYELFYDGQKAVPTTQITLPSPKKVSEY